MAVLCWSVKGGCGTTVVAAAIAIVLARSTAADAPVWAVDLAGDLPTALGLPEPDGPGVRQWLAADPPPAAAAWRHLLTRVDDRLAVLHAGPPTDQPADPGGWARMASTLAGHDGGVVVDAGNGVPPVPLLEVATTSLLVVRPCYLALRRAVPHAAAATGVALVREHGRALTTRDVHAALGVPVVVEIPFDPAVTRAVDAGLLAARLPHSLDRGLRHVA